MDTAEYRASLVEEYGQVWDTEGLQREFTVEGFCYGVCIVRRKSDNVRGTLDFTHMPRIYFNFQAE